jgi:hypothetical protein
MNLLALILANSAVLLGAHAALRRLRTGETTTDLVIYQLVRLGLISLVVLAAGAAKALTPLAFGIAGAAVTAVFLALGEHRRLPRLRLPDVGTGALIFAGVLIVRSLLQVWLFAPFQRDALTYHLPKIGEWIQHRGFTAEWGLDLRSTFPSGFELIETWWVAPLRHDILIEMAGLEFLLLGAAAAADIARRLDAPPKFVFLAGLLYALTPGICLQATSCLNDGPVAALWTATAALALRTVPLPMLLIPIGLGIGVKPTYAYGLPGIALMGWLVARKRDPGTKAAAAAGMLGLLVGSVWYLRNLVVYGNPIHPMGRSGISVQEGHVAQRFGPSFSGLIENLDRLADSRIYDHLGPYDPELPLISGWGPATMAAGLVALFLTVRTVPLMRRIAGGYVVALLTVLALVVPDPWYLRYVLFFPGLFAVATAKAAESARAVALVAWIALGVQLVGTMIPGRFPIGGMTDLASMSWRERTFYRHPKLEGVDAVGFIEQPADETKVYPLYRPDFSRRVVYLRPTSPENLLEILRRENLSTLVSLKPHPLVQPLIDSGRLVSLNSGYYRVR